MAEPHRVSVADEIYESPGKTRTARRTIDLDDCTVGVLSHKGSTATAMSSATSTAPPSTPNSSPTHSSGS